MPLPNDPLIASQWYLQNTGQRGAAGIDINLAPIAGRWTGKGVVVAINDDGMDLDHPDLLANYLLNLVYDATRDTTGQGFAAGAERAHGTVVGSIVGMVANNGIGGAGIAYESQIVPALTGGDDTNARLFLANLAANAAVSVNSWGNDTAFGENFGATGSAPMRAWGEALARAAAESRGGLGMVIEVSGGNERGNRADNSLSNFNGNKVTISVGAVTHEGKVTGYSTPGLGLLVTAPGGVGSNADASVDSGFGIASADISGSGGYNTKSGAAGDYAFQNQGTSYSGPMVGAVAALMLQASPGLGFRDVSMILAMTARKNDPTSTSWVQQAGNEWNLGGMHYSRDFGYGLLDAAAAVRLAESWAGGTNTVANWQSVQGASSAPSQTLPDNTGAFLTVTADVSGNLVIERIEVDLNLTATAPSQLAAVLISPSGTSHIVFDQPLTRPLVNGSPDMSVPETAWPGTFTIGIAAYLGEPSQGTWTLRLIDGVTGVEATYNSLTVRAWGRPVQPENQYVFTDEFAGSKALADAGGVDVLNAAALSSTVTILLDGSGDTTIGAGTITIAAGTTIENATGGAVADTLRGNAAANTLRGNDGNDAIFGLDGDDVLVGGLGADALAGGAGGDVFRLRAPTESGLAGWDSISDFDMADKIDFAAIAGVGLSLGGYAFSASVAATIDAIRLDNAVANRVVFFTSGADGYLYVNGAGSGTSFDGALLELKGRSAAPAASQFAGFADAMPPTVVAFSPAGGGVNVPIDSNLVVTFSEAIQRGTGNILIKDAQGNAVQTFDAASSGRLGITGNVLTINPSNFANGAQYSVEFPAGGIRDLAGNDHAGLATYSFTTIAASVPGVTRNGTAGVDALLGSAGADTLTALAGNDLLVGLAGNDTLDGGDGIDTGVYVYNRSAYSISRSGGTITVSGLEGTDTLTAVERAVFANGWLAFDIDGNAGQTYRLYQAAFARQPDVSGLSFWIGQMDNGASLPTVAAQFIGSAEFISKYGANPTNEQFVTLLYQNVLNRLPDAGGLAFWVNQLNAGTITRPEVLIGFSESTENKANVLPAINSGIVYQPTVSTAGTAGVEQFVGTAGVDTFSALGGRDLLIGLGGNDQLNGGADLDTAGYGGTRNQYVVVYNAGNLTVTDSSGVDGIDALAEIERLAFADRNLAFDIAGNAGQTYRLYQAAFARTPDTPGLSFWIGQMDLGAALLGVAGQFIASAEFTTKYGANPSNADFVTLLYQNVLNRLPDAGGLAFWVNQLDGGTIARPEVLIGFSESTENQMALIGVLQQGIEYLPLG